MVDAILEVDENSTVLDSNVVNEVLLGASVAAKIFPPSMVSLAIEDDTFTYENVINDVRTNYGMTLAEAPHSRLVMQKKKVNAPLIMTAIQYDRFQKKRINRSKLPVSARERIILEDFALDMDMYAIAGESTYNGVAGISDTTNFSTAASTELDLTSYTTLKSTLNTIITQLTTAISADSRARNEIVKQNPLILLVTSDVYNRLTAMGSGTAEENLGNGHDVATTILNQRGGNGSGIEVSDCLGGTVTKVADGFSLSTAGTTNAALICQHPRFFGWARSPLDQAEDEDNRGYENLITQRLVPYAVNTGGIIYSGTVDITA